MTDDKDDVDKTIEGFGEVIELKNYKLTLAETSKPPIRVHQHRKRDDDKPMCFHRSTCLDFRARVVWCADCDVDLDPIDVLQNLGYTSDYTHARQDKKKLEAICEALTAEKKRLRAAVNKLRKQAGEQPWNEWNDWESKQRR
jgi:hypothetical protein